MNSTYRFCPQCATPLAHRPIDGRQLLACPSCSFVFWNDPKPCVSALIQRDGTVLMLQREHEPFAGFWVLPGGFMQTEETPEASIIREVSEETGLDFTPERLIGAYRIGDDPRGIHIDLIYAGSVAGELKMNHESRAAIFVPLTTLPAQIAYQHREAIHDASR